MVCGAHWKASVQAQPAQPGLQLGPCARLPCSFIALCFLPGRPSGEKASSSFLGLMDPLSCRRTPPRYAFSDAQGGVQWSICRAPDPLCHP